MKADSTTKAEQETTSTGCRPTRSDHERRNWPATNSPACRSAQEVPTTTAAEAASPPAATASSWILRLQAGREDTARASARRKERK